MEWAHENVYKNDNVIDAMAVLPDNRIVINSWKYLKVIDTVSGAIRTLKGHSNKVQCITVFPDGRIASGSSDETVKVWDLKTGEHETYTGHNGTVWCVTVLSDGKLASGSRDKYVKVWDTTASELPGGVSVWGVQTLRGHTSDVICVDGLPDGRVVSGSSDNTVKVWDLKGGVQSRTVHKERVSCLLALPNGSIVSGSWDQTVAIWNPDDDTVRRFVGPGWDFNCLSQLPDGRIIAGSDDKTLKVWNLENNEVQMLEGHTETITCLGVLSDGRIVTGSWDETVKVWEWKQFDNRDRYKPVVKLGHKTFPSGTRLFTLITSETFDRTRDLAFFGKHLGLNVRATLHNTSESDYVWLHVFNTTGPLRMLTAPRQWRQAIYGSSYISLKDLEKRLIFYCQQNGYDGWHMRVKMDNRVSNVKEAEYETVVLKSSFDKLQFRGKKRITLEDLKDKDHVRVSKKGKITFVKRIERLEEMFENLRF